MDPPRHTAYRRLFERHFSSPDAWKISNRFAGRFSQARIKAGRSMEIDLVTQLAQRWEAAVE
jgi:cytochrome P450